MTPSISSLCKYLRYRDVRHQIIAKHHPNIRVYILNRRNRITINLIWRVKIKPSFICIVLKFTSNNCQLSGVCSTLQIAVSFTWQEIETRKRFVILLQSLQAGRLSLLYLLVYVPVDVIYINMRTDYILIAKVQACWSSRC